MQRYVSRSVTLAYAAVAHLAATSSFAYLLGFLLGARVPRSVDRGGPATSPLAAAAIDVLFLAAFTMPHSVLAPRRRRSGAPSGSAGRSARSAS